jgi:DNA (cytosine-5-)-methyltransferase
MFRVIETFSGIGSQAKALTRIGRPFEIVNTADWDINAILAYCLIHKGKIDVDKYTEVSDENVTEFLTGFSLSSDGKKPMNAESFKRIPMHLKRRLYAAIKETNNLVSITDIKGEDIPENIDLFTYSFPCQDLSLCGCWHGNKSGIARDAHNRSGMLWEVERILLEMNEQGKELPRFLLMENVTNILSKPHKEDFGDWKSTLESLGYYNQIYRLNSKNFGIPQNRERAYMISVLCKNNKDIINAVKKYFEEHNLEKDEAERLKQRELMLKDILCLDYKGVPQYKKEADASKPNDTASRMKIFEDNDMLYDGKKINEMIVNTVTTKQDRNPNSGLITYKNYARGKTKWRYLTPRECFKLMGFDEADFDKVISDNPMVTKSRSLYSTEKLIKMAGNSIVVDVLEAIFRQIMDVNTDILGERE